MRDAYAIGCAIACACSTHATTGYVWASSPNPKSPYTNWTTASHAIQTAIDAAVTVNGDTILVTNGVYSTGGKVVVQTTNRVAVTKAITVRSVNGPSVTIIRGAFAPGTTNGVTSYGVPWGWLLQYGWATDGSDDLDDPDGDGFLVWMRYVAGTDPTNSASRFKVVAVSNAPQSQVFFLPDLVGRVYTLEYADDLSTGIWTPVSGQYRVPGTGPGQYLIDPDGGARARFYRVHVALP